MAKRPHAGVVAALISLVVAAGAIAADLDGPGETRIREQPREFVRIPGKVPHAPGGMIDRRIRRNLKWIAANFPKIWIEDGFAGKLADGTKVGCPRCHVRHSEHKIGLAVDIYPLRRRAKERERCDRRWRDVTALAKWAEPRQDQPRPPFRWVGYRGDSGHGCGKHLHLSWAHHKRYRKFKPSKWAEVFRVSRRDTGDGSESGGQAASG